MKTEQPIETRKSAGKYIGQHPEHLFMGVGDVVFSSEGICRITEKKYLITPGNYDYDIELVKPPLTNDETDIELSRGQQETAPLELPLPPNLTTDSHEYLLTLSTGDKYVDANGQQGTVSMRHFRYMPNGLLRVTAFLN